MMRRRTGRERDGTVTATERPQRKLEAPRSLVKNKKTRPSTSDVAAPLSKQRLAFRISARMMEQQSSKASSSKAASGGAAALAHGAAPPTQVYGMRALPTRIALICLRTP